MGKLIDADAIPWDVDGVGFIPVIGKDEIDEMPEAVVRCKECRWKEEYHGGLWCNRRDGLNFIDDNSFCSYGERREANE